MSDLKLRAVMDDTQVRRGVQNLAHTVNTSLKAAFMGGLGIAGALGAVVTLRSAFDSMVQDVSSSSRLLDTLARRHVDTARAQLEISQKIRELRRLGIDDTAATEALDKLVSMTDDYAGSLRNLNLVTDLAVKMGGNWATATRLVAFVMKGEIEQAGRLVPEIRELSRVHQGLAGSARGAALGMQVLQRYAGNAAAAEYQTLRGSLKAVGNAMGEVAEAFAEGATGGEELVTTLQKLNEWLLKLADNPGVKTLGQYLPGYLKGGWMGWAGVGSQMSQEELQKGLQKPTIFDHIGMALARAGYTNGYSSRINPGTPFNPTSPALPPTPLSVFGFGVPLTAAQQKQREEEAKRRAEEAARLAEQQLQFQRNLVVFGFEHVRSLRESNLSVRGGMRDPQDIIERFRMGDRRGRNPVADRLLEDERARQQQLQMGIQNAAEVGLTAALNGGSVREAMKQLFIQSLAGALAEQGAKAAVGFISRMLGMVAGGPVGGAVAGGTVGSSANLQILSQQRRVAALG